VYPGVGYVELAMEQRVESRTSHADDVALRKLEFLRVWLLPPLEARLGGVGSRIRFACSGGDFEIASDSGRAANGATSYVIHARGKDVAGSTGHREGTPVCGVCRELGASSGVQAVTLYRQKNPCS